MPNPKPSILYPSRCNDKRRREKANDQIEKFYKIFKDLSFEISLTDALILMSKFASTLKALIENKEKLSKMARTPLNEHCLAVILNKLPEKLRDPDKFLIPCDFPGMDECLALADLGANINLMPLSVRILQKSQENGQNRTNTDRRTDRVQKSRKNLAKDTKVPSQQELELLFGPLYDEFFNDGTSRVNKSSSPTDNSIKKDTLPSMHIQPPSKPSTPTNVHAEENNDNQAEFTNPFYNTLCFKVIDDIDKSTMYLLFIPSYTLEILKKHGMENGKALVTPMAPDTKLDATFEWRPGRPKLDYRSKIGPLMYLDILVGPDLSEAVCTINMGLWYPKGSGFKLTAFSDADHAGCVDTRKSTSEGIQFLGDKLVSWMSKKQDCTAMSSSEAETWSYLQVVL
ncbi:hypothetical protein Tco_1230064 [Tanacetum coccineum]